jgi:hypothetical protein
MKILTEPWHETQKRGQDRHVAKVVIWKLYNFASYGKELKIIAGGNLQR